MESPSYCNRRHFLETAAAITASPLLIDNARAEESLLMSAKSSVELAHAEIWRRFVDKHGVLLDFTNLDGSISLPTAEECREGKPNALGWWTPIENGAMFNGLYLDGIVSRALRTKAAEDKAKALRLVEGLLRLANCSSVKGFVGRGFASDGKTTWPMGSNDQTSPWFYGLWRFLESGLADGEIRTRVIHKMIEVADVLAATDWRMPAEKPFRFRGALKHIEWIDAPRLLFLCKAMYRLTGDELWEKRYRTALAESSPNGTTRLMACERGMVYEKDGTTKAGRATWTGSCAAVALRGVWEMEDDLQLRSSYAQGLRATAAMAAIGMNERHGYDPNNELMYETDWRKINKLWKQQQSPEEAEAVAKAQLNELHRLSPSRRAELKEAREAIFSAWVVTLCPEREIVERHNADILATLAHFRADHMHFASFFPLECAWWRL